MYAYVCVGACVCGDVVVCMMCGCMCMWRCSCVYDVWVHVYVEM